MGADPSGEPAPAVTASEYLGFLSPAAVGTRWELTRVLLSVHASAGRLGPPACPGQGVAGAALLVCGGPVPPQR